MAIEDFHIAMQESIKNNNSKRIINLLLTMKLYFEKVPIETIIAGQTLTIQSLELIAFQGQNANLVYEELGRFLSVF